MGPTQIKVSRLPQPSGELPQRAGLPGSWPSTRSPRPGTTHHLSCHIVGFPSSLSPAPACCGLGHTVALQESGLDRAQLPLPSFHTPAGPAAWVQIPISHSLCVTRLQLVLPGTIGHSPDSEDPEGHEVTGRCRSWR